MEQIQNTNWKSLNREERGRLISKSSRIVKMKNSWSVTSQSKSNHSYLVKFNGHKPKCNCPDCTINKKKCKHIYAVEFYIKREINEEGKLTQTAQINELLCKILAHNICVVIQEVNELGLSSEFIVEKNAE